MSGRPRTFHRVAGVELAKSQVSKPVAKGRKQPTTKRPRKPPSSAASKAKAGSAKKSTSLSQLLSPKNVQETIKTVGNLRGMVKNWLGYLQQADKMLDTVFVTTGSLKESGVLDKLVKERGKNLSTDDFTNILAALMSSPLASGFLKGGDDEKETEKDKAKAPAQAAPPQPDARAQGVPQQGYPMQQPQGYGYPPPSLPPGQQGQNNGQTYPPQS